jgi:hypothetical protein
LRKLVTYPAGNNGMLSVESLTVSEVVFVLRSVVLKTVQVASKVCGKECPLGCGKKLTTHHNFICGTSGIRCAQRIGSIALNLRRIN